MIAILIRQYIFCLIGAATRFIIEIAKSLQSKKPTPTFNQIYNYEKNPENEILDAIIGFLILGLTVTLIFT